MLFAMITPATLRLFAFWTIASLMVIACMPRPQEISATRLFAGPTQYPPDDFAAYGIVAFPSHAAPTTRDRHLLICEAYMAALPHTSAVDVPKAEQMVTIWPMESNADAVVLNKRSRPRNACESAVDKYSIVMGKEAIGDAKATGAQLNGLGPYLLAWSPSSSKGKHDALVLVADLSNVTSYPQAEEYFRKWSDDIESDPKLWKGGWNLEQLRVAIRDWADKFGPGFLSTLGG